MRVGNRRFGTRTNGGLFMRRVPGTRGNTAMRFSGILLMSGSKGVAMNIPAMRNTGIIYRIISGLMGNSGMLIFRGGEEGNREGLGNRHRRFARLAVARMMTWSVWGWRRVTRGGNINDSGGNHRSRDGELNIGVFNNRTYGTNGVVVHRENARFRPNRGVNVNGSRALFTLMSKAIDFGMAERSEECMSVVPTRGARTWDLRLEGGRKSTVRMVMSPFFFVRSGK